LERRNPPRRSPPPSVSRGRSRPSRGGYDRPSFGRSPPDRSCADLPRSPAPWPGPLRRKGLRPSLCSDTVVPFSVHSSYPAAACAPACGLRALAPAYLQIQSRVDNAPSTRHRLVSPVNAEKGTHEWVPFSQRMFRRCPTLPHPGECSTIGAGGLSFRVRNGTGRFPTAIAAVTL
jgi:hypothetical protein